MKTFYQLISKDGLIGPITESKEPVYSIKTVLKERLAGGAVAEGALPDFPEPIPSRTYEYESKEAVLLVTMREK